MKKINYLFLIIITFELLSCNSDWLTENPLDELSEGSFWKSEDDALLALTGVYNYSPENSGLNLQGAKWVNIQSDDVTFKVGTGFRIGDFKQSAEAQVVRGTWQRSYRVIYRCNSFLDNIDKVEMDASRKAEYIAEVKFLRAREYFWLTQFWGDVPLITAVISIDEANSHVRNPKQEVVDFVLSDLTAAAASLPVSRPDAQRGRVIKAAPLSVKGKLLMAEKRWAEAASAFKAVMDLGYHVIDPDFEKLFQADDNGASKEVIFHRNYIAGLSGNNHAQKNFMPQFYGGYEEYCTYQNLVDAFLMNDGLSIEDSPLYDSSNPFVNRDPRLYMSVFLPGYTVWRGKTFQGHPDKTDEMKKLERFTGYHCKKFTKEIFSGDWNSAGQDEIIIRYGEVLLSYLESKLEAGDVITQSILDESINKVRGRVNMPFVTETDQTKLRKIVRNERRVELAFERCNRHWDIIRWGIAQDVLNQKFYGMKITDDPAHYTAFLVNAEGHKFVVDHTGFFDPNKHYLWPIPQDELDLNPNIGQNPGY